MSPYLPGHTRFDVGIDLGVRRLAIGWPYWGVSYAIDLGKAPAERGHELRALQEWVRETLPDHVRLWIENPYVSNGLARNQTTSLAMSETLSAVLTAHQWGYPPERVGQSTWKAQVIGNGRASKEEVQVWLHQMYPDLWDAVEGDEDRCDAMCIGLYGTLRTKGAVEPPVSRPKKRRRKGKA